MKKEHKCLDHGFVRLIDHMGSDQAIVQAARVSYGEGTKSVREDRGLIRYLLRHEHTSPFEMVEFKFHCRMPIFVARQWIRHRTANVNEYSMRYSNAIDEFYVPEQNVIRLQSKDNKQGRSDEEVSESIKIATTDIIKGSSEYAFSAYRAMTGEDIARELARIVLPVNAYTEWYWKIDLHNLLHFLKLRLDSHSQYEIRVYAQSIAKIVKEIVPVTWEAFEDYVLYAEKFSRQEMGVIQMVLNSFKEILKVEGAMFWENEEELTKQGLSKGEIKEFINKLVEESNNE